ncbi:hypothetical protein [Flavobacterium sp.]|uniref:hypothetical protein n=1 Tax=Flavobacterium sp. TaxID=239 RepID=UPI0039E51C80
MNKVLLFGVLLFCPILAAQSKKNRSDLNRFLLGILGDYEGKMSPYDHPKIQEPLTYIFCGEEPYQKIILDSLGKIGQVKFELEVEKGAIYSKELSSFFNEFYTRELIPDYGFYDTIENKDYAYYFLILKQQKFKKAYQKVSFLAGTFYRYGTINADNEITLTFVRANSHIVACENFIRKLGFKVVNIFHPDYYSISGAHQITFVPSKKYLPLFRHIDSTRPDKGKCTYPYQ